MSAHDMTCGSCGRTWNDQETPTPAAWCPFEYDHAEPVATPQGWEIRWEGDWEVGSHVHEYGYESYPQEPTTCEVAYLVDADGTVLNSLGCIDDATDEYRREIEGELIAEALHDLQVKGRRFYDGLLASHA